MNARAQLADPPAWVAAEMPPGYQNRLAEIRRLSEELQDMDRYGRLLWAIGPTLRESVRDVFTALKLDVELMEGSADSAIAVKLDIKRRLLLHVSATEGAVDKKSPEIAHVFRMLHEVAGDSDRVVLVVNGDRMNQPTERPEPVTAEALKLLQRMGANCVTAPTLFKLWGLAVQDPERARKFVGRLHEQDGGIFALPTVGLWGSTSTRRGTTSTVASGLPTASGSLSDSRFVISAVSICSPVPAGTPREKSTGGRKNVAASPAAAINAPAPKTRCERVDELHARRALEPCHAGAHPGHAAPAGAFPQGVREDRAHDRHANRGTDAPRELVQRGGDAQRAIGATPCCTASSSDSIESPMPEPMRTRQQSTVCVDESASINVSPMNPAVISDAARESRAAGSRDCTVSRRPQSTSSPSPGTAASAPGRPAWPCRPSPPARTAG